MFTVSPFCRTVLWLLMSRFVFFINTVWADVRLLLMSLAFLVWWHFHLAGILFSFEGGQLVKETGKTFKRKTIIMLKNISYIQTFILHPRLPAVIRVSAYSQSLLIIGLDGRQVLMLERYIMQLK